MTGMMGHDEFTITFHMVNGIMQTFRVTNLSEGSAKEHKDTMADWNSCSYAEAQPCSVATCEAPPCLKTALRTGGIKLSYSLAVELGRGAWPRAVSLVRSLEAFAKSRYGKVDEKSCLPWASPVRLSSDQPPAFVSSVVKTWPWSKRKIFSASVFHSGSLLRSFHPWFVQCEQHSLLLCALLTGVKSKLVLLIFADEENQERNLENQEGNDLVQRCRSLSGLANGGLLIAGTTW